VRPHLLVVGDRARASVAAGFALLAVAALAAGGGYVDDAAAPGLVALRLVGIAFLVAAPLRWPGAAVGRLGVSVGIGALLAAEAVLAADRPALADGLRLGAAAAVATGTFLAARRSIPTRIATSASATLLVVVLAVSVGLSAVLADSVEDEARRRLDAGATTEAALATEAARTADFNASLTARALGNEETVAANIANLAQGTGGDATILTSTLEAFAREFLVDSDPQLGPMLVLAGPAGQDPHRVAVALPSIEGFAPPSEVELAGVEGSAVVTSALGIDDRVQSIVASGEATYAVAAAPIDVGPQVQALLVVTSRLDHSYLATRLATGADEGDGLAIVTRAGAVVATAGAVPASDDAADLAARAIDSGMTVTRTVGDRIVAAEPVLGSDGVPVVAVVASTPTAAVQETRSDLFRLLFLIAIAGTALALVLTAVVGERIGAGLRRLTVVAGEVQGGNLLASSGVSSDDELGVLSGAFDSMTGSLRRMTAELRQSAEDEARLRTRMEAVVGGMGEAVVAVDANGDVTDFNPAAELLTGVPARKAVGRPVDQIIRAVADDDDGDLSIRLREPVDESWTAGATVLHTTGLEVPVIVSAGTLRGASNQHAGAVYLLRDVRREREVERIKSELLSNISHELRTPLSPIKGYSQILRAREIPPDDVRRFANEIEKASARLERVVVQLVNFASMSAGRYEVRTEPTLVREVLDRVVGRWVDRLDDDKHRIVKRVARGVPKIWIDRVAVDQALDELIDNAVKYSPDGGRIDVAATAAAHPTIGPSVRISVTDRGVGIPDDRRDVVLEEFTQADGSATRTFGGLGLGLALVARIVRAHGGDLELVSLEGRGTTVTMVLPVGEEG
jgi:two-component system sensor histidine kinase VicK